MTGQEAPITQWEHRSVRVHRRKVRAACRLRCLLPLFAACFARMPALCCLEQNIPAVLPFLQVFTLGWNSEGKRLASGSVDQTVRITRVDAYCAVRALAAALQDPVPAAGGSSPKWNPASACH